jgi:flagellar hook protein FlgE
VTKPVESVFVPTTPSASPLAVAIDGAGFFLVARAGRTYYTRLGDFRFDQHGTLVDGEGRTVLGFAPSHDGHPGSLVPIERRDAKGASIDAAGTISVEGARGKEAIGRLALAVFPAPERLGRLDDTSLRSTADSGRPQIVAPGAPNVGKLNAHALENALVNVAGDLEGMWRAQRRGETQAAAAAADDSCERAVLGLVR